MSQQNPPKKEEDLKMFMKYDTGVGGFENMIFVLAVGAVVVLLLGIYFIFKIFLPEFQA